MTKNNTPALRFDGFDGAWETSKIADLFAERVESFPEGELLSVTTHRGIKRFEEIGRHDTSNADKSKYKLVEIGDIAYNSMRMWQGASGVSPYRGIVSPAYTVLQPVAEVDSGFFSFLFKVPSLVSVFKEHSQGLTSDTWNLKFPAFSEIEATHPAPEEQRAIGELFADLDALIEQHRAKHKNLQQMKTALMQRMFPQDGVDEPELRLGGFSGAWESRTLSELTAINNGLDYKHLNEGDIPVYGTGGYMLSVDRALSYKADAIGIGRKGTIDKPYLLRAPFWTVDTLFYVTAHEGANLQFLLAQFQRVDWKSKNTATGVPSLTSVSIGQTSVSIPPTLEEQRAIGEVFADLDALITAEANYITQLTQAKTALLQRMFI